MAFGAIVPRRAMLGVAGAALARAAFGQGDEREAERRALVERIEVGMRALAPVTGVERIAPEILAAFEAVPRHLFVPAAFAPYAYLDRPLPLGHGQNLTQPSVAALMTQLIEPRRGMKVFETGTDTGYQAAILARLGLEVFSVEVVEPLLRVAEEIFRRRDFGRIALRLGDGWYGWPEAAPFDAMLIKESATHVPPPLLSQLAPGGRMVIPLGPPENEQWLTLVTRRPDGGTSERQILPVRFAPFQGGERI
jgi:protein-L-isoaspartate(D-aspartate) O-methyltransferase